MTLFGIQSNDIEFIGLQSISKEKMIAFLMEQNQTLTTTTIKQGLDKFNFIQTLSVDENNGKIIVKLQEKPSISNFEFVGFSNDLEEKLSSKQR
jgi:outer membrane protein assembly factor BamA